MPCDWCEDGGFVCEHHPTYPMHHVLPRTGAPCGGAGMPCSHPETAHGRAHLKDPSPQTRLLQFEDESESRHRPVLYLTGGLAPGEWLLVDLSEFPHRPPVWIAAEILPEPRAYVTKVKRIEP